MSQQQKKLQEGKRKRVEHELARILTVLNTMPLRIDKTEQQLHRTLSWLDPDLLHRVVASLKEVVNTSDVKRTDRKTRAREKVEGVDPAFFSAQRALPTSYSQRGTPVRVDSPGFEHTGDSRPSGYQRRWCLDAAQTFAQEAEYRKRCESGRVPEGGSTRLLINRVMAPHSISLPSPPTIRRSCVQVIRYRFFI